MNEFERRAELIARIHTLQRRAAAVESPSIGETLNGDSSQLIQELHAAESAVEARPERSVLDEVERMVDATSIFLSSLGRAH